MVDFLKKYISFVFGSSGNGRTSLDEAVRHSVKKYYNTYKLLEEYDKKPEKKTKVLADPEGVRDYFQPLHR